MYLRDAFDQANHLSAWIIISVFTSSLHCSVASAENTDSGGDPVALLLSSVEAHAADFARFQIATGAGTTETLISDGNKYFVDQINFEVKNTSVWIELNPIESEPQDTLMFPKVQLVADGTTVAAVKFSDRIQPVGCQVDIRGDNVSYYGIAARSRIDLRRHLIPEWLRMPPLEDYKKLGAEVSYGGLVDGLECVVVRYKDCHWKFWLDASWDNRVVNAELFVQDDRVVKRYKYEYTRENGGVRPKTLEVLDYCYKSVDKFDTYTLHLESLVPGVNKTTFSLNDLDVCSGARVIDRRKDTETPVRNSVPTTTAQMPNATISEQVSALPDRYRTDKTSGEPESRTSLIQLLLLINLIAVITIAVTWYVMKRKRKAANLR